MSSIKSFIEGHMTGNAWEDLCVRCYRIRYQKDNYTAIPATQGGDAGIEGFTYKGVVSSVTARSEIILIMNYMSINATSLLQI